MNVCEICGQKKIDVVACRMCGEHFCGECGDLDNHLCLNCADEVEESYEDEVDETFLESTQIEEDIE